MTDALMAAREFIVGMGFIARSNRTYNQSISDLAALLTRREAEAVAAAINSAVPTSYYADLPSTERLQFMVKGWQRALLVNLELEEKRYGYENAAVAAATPEIQIKALEWAMEHIGEEITRSPGRRSPMFDELKPLAAKDRAYVLSMQNPCGLCERLLLRAFASEDIQTVRIEALEAALRSMRSALVMHGYTDSYATVNAIDAALGTKPVEWVNVRFLKVWGHPTRDLICGRNSTARVSRWIADILAKDGYAEVIEEPSR